MLTAWLRGQHDRNRLVTHARSSESNCQDWLIIALLVIATVGWSVAAGKDLNFDQLSYHFYLPFQLFGDRLTQDFMAANGQSYLNPLPYAPFYWMVRNDWPSVLIAAVLAAIHSLNVVLAYFITKAALREDLKLRRTAATLGAVLALLSPVFLTEAGATFADITTSVLVLTAVLTILNSEQPQPWWQSPALVAGVLMGAAGGMKLSNVVFVPALALMLVWRYRSVPQVVRAGLLFASGGFLGLLAVHGYWGWQLWKEFGNPFFPLLSSIFPSPDYPQLSGAPGRFIPDGPLDYLLLPFRMMQLRAWIYIENVAPDLRFAAALCGSAGVIIAVLLQRFSKSSRTIRASARGILFLVTFLATYALWLATSGNGRYGLVVSLLCGPALVIIADLLFARRQIAICVLAALICLQSVHLSNGQIRWISGKWTRSWYEVSIPQRLRKQPFLYVSVGGNANSYLFPFLAPGSAFTNPIGQVSIDLEGPGGARLQQLLKRHGERIRVIALTPDTDNTNGFPLWTANVGALIGRLGYAIDSSDCETITAAGISYEAGQDFDNSDIDVRRFRTCHLIPKKYDQAEERKRVQKIANEIARWCPKLFQPYYSVAEQQVGGWVVGYPGTDMILAIRGDQILATQLRTTADIYLGTLASWEEGRRPDCVALPEKPRETYKFD